MSKALIDTCERLAYDIFEMNKEHLGPMKVHLGLQRYQLLLFGSINISDIFWNE